MARRKDGMPRVVVGGLFQAYRTETEERDEEDQKNDREA